MKSNAFRIGFIATLGALLAVLLGLALTSIATILVYLAAALFIALGLDPIVRLLERRGLKRMLAITIVFVLFTLLIIGVLFLVLPVVFHGGTALVNGLPQAVTNVWKQDWFISLNQSLGGAINMSSLSSSLGTFLSNPTNLATLGGGVLKVGSDIVGGIFGGITIVILSLFFLGSL